MINNKDPFKPILCFDAGEESNRAVEIMTESSILFHNWDAQKFPPYDWTPPFLIRGRNLYMGLSGIRGFVMYYPELMEAEKTGISPAGKRKFSSFSFIEIFKTKKD